MQKHPVPCLIAAWSSYNSITYFGSALSLKRGRDHLTRAYGCVQLIQMKSVVKYFAFSLLRRALNYTWLQANVQRDHDLCNFFFLLLTRSGETWLEEVVLCFYFICSAILVFVFIDLTWNWPISHLAEKTCMLYLIRRFSTALGGLTAKTMHMYLSDQSRNEFNGLDD